MYVKKSVTFPLSRSLFPSSPAYIIDKSSHFICWHDLSMFNVMQEVNKANHMNKRELIKTLILSPLYWKLKLKDRAVLIRKMIPRK